MSKSNGKRSCKNENEDTRPSKKKRTENLESSDDDDGDMDMSQKPDFKTSEKPEVGIVEKVMLRNFMCHNKLDITFNSNVNFLVGRNGSGKSAILTGIVVGLGGKAATTNRGTSIKGFIKNGKNSTLVSVKLRNRGQDAFKALEYGTSIIVERRINSDSQGGYKIKSADGKVISTKREELTRILDQFNIQVDNPVAILNQETSRNFLHSKSPHDKYKFFLKATQLEQMKDDYIIANEYKNSSIRLLRNKEEVMPVLKRNVEDLETKFKAFSTIEDLREKIKRLKNEMAWAIVLEREKALDPLKQELKVEEMRTPKFVKHVQESEQKVNTIVQAYNDVQKQIKDMSKEMSDLEPQHKDLRAIRDDKKKVFKQIQNETAMLKRDLRSHEKEKKQIEDRIAELRQSVQHDYEAQRRAREERIKQQQEQADSLRAQEKTSRHSMEQFGHAVTRARESLYQLRNEEKDLRRTRDQIRAQINNLESARSNRLRRFGAYMPDLIAKIDEACRKSQFHEKPRGPIGVSVTLCNEKWAQAVEVCLGGLLHAFCVTDHHDERKLQEIMRRVLPKNSKMPGIITSRFRNQIYDVSTNRVNSCHPTVLDMINIKELDPVLVNCLIDQRAVESILLIGESREARHVMSSQPPRNTREAFTLEGDQLYCHPTFRYYSNTQKQANLLTANLEENISALKEHLQKCDGDLQNLQQQMAQQNSDIRKNEVQEKATQTQLQKIKQQIARFDFEIQELENYEEPTAPDVTTLEEEVVHKTDLIQGLQTQLDGINRRLEESKDEYDQAEKSYSEVDKKIRGIAQNCDPVQEEVAKIEGQLDKAKADMKHYKNKMDEHEKKIDTLKTNLETRENNLKDDVMKASEICEKIKTRRSAKNLESEILQIEKRIALEEKSRGNKEEITRDYYRVLEEYKRARRQIGQLKEFLKCLEEVMEQRQDRFRVLRRMIAMRAKYIFIMMLNERQYTGKIQFDHDQEMLNLSVQPHSSREQEKASKSDMKSLSGGERSFSTVCFIMALWDAMESPFRMLDEFDVFMDMVNRRVSMQMMMQTASQQTKRQFIFLTPLDMSYLNQHRNVQVFRLEAPQEGQTTLPFGEQNGQEEEEHRDNGQRAA